MKIPAPTMFEICVLDAVNHFDRFYRLYPKCEFIRQAVDSLAVTLKDKASLKYLSDVKSVKALLAQHQAILKTHGGEIHHVHKALFSAYLQFIRPEVIETQDYY